MAKKKLTHEEQVLERLTRMEEQLGVIARSHQSQAELRRDLAPLINSAFRIMMEELGEVEFGFQLEDFFVLLKRGLRSIRNLTYALEQLESLINLWQALEPLLKSSVPNLINYLDDLEQKGVFRTYTAMLEVRAKVAAHYGPEEITAMGEGFVLVLGMLQKLSNPEMISFINRLLDLPLEANLKAAPPLSPLKALGALGKSEVKQGLGVMLELVKALGTLKEDVGRPALPPAAAVGR